MLPYVYLEIVVLFLGLSCAVQDVEWQSVGVKTSGLIFFYASLVALYLVNN